MTQEKAIEEIKKPIKVKYVLNESEDDIQYQKELDAITDKAFSDMGTTQALKNIRETLVCTLRSKYKITDKAKLKEISDGLLKIHGLHESNFDFVNSFSKFMTQKVSDVSIDDNANKSDVSVKGLLKETTLCVDKLIGFDHLYRVLVELYGQKEAKRLSGEMYDLSLGLSDSSNILIPYCYAIDASRLVTQGRDFGILKSAPSKRLSSYIAALCETLHQLSSHVAGALAVGSFFSDVAHLLIYKQRVSLKDVSTNKKIRKEIENEFQQFVHSVNFLSRNAIESPFTNLSSFDKEKLQVFLSDDNFGWLFPNNTKVCVDNEMGADSDYKINDEEYKKFVLEYIFELQKIFIDFFDKGDALNGGIQFRFPVKTINLTKKTKDGVDYVDKDNELLNYIVKKDISRYNIFTSKGTKLASCCRLVSDAEMMELASSANSFGGASISIGSHRVNTINLVRLAYETSSYEEYFPLLKERIHSASKILRAHRALILKMTDKGLHPFIKNGWLNLNRMFSTFGVLGVVEAEIILKKRFNVQYKDVMGDILKNFNDFATFFSKEYGFIFNIEQIPAESFAVRLAESDKLIFGDEDGNFCIDDGKKEITYDAVYEE